MKGSRGEDHSLYLYKYASKALVLRIPNILKKK